MPGSLDKIHWAWGLDFGPGNWIFGLCALRLGFDLTTLAENWPDRERPKT
jgi:hypothetical protein